MLAVILVRPRSVSLTPTWKLPVVTSGGLAASLALQLTVVVPIAKVLPEAGEQLTVGVQDASSGSLAVTLYATVAPCGLVSTPVSRLPSNLSIRPTTTHAP